MINRSNQLATVSALAMAGIMLGVSTSASAADTIEGSEAPASRDASANTDGSSTGLNEIIVTAQKRSQNLQDVPAVINALDAGMIEDRQIGGLEELQGAVAGLKFDPVSGNSNISIRGVGTTFTTGAGENSVSLHLDGVYLSSPQGAGLGQFDLGGIEVLRGPQGTLYGKNSTAGIVNFISAAPTREFEAGVTAGYGNYDDLKGSAYVSGPLSDGVRARLYIEGGQRDGYVKNLQTGQDLDDLRYIGGRFGIDADVSPGWDMEARLTYRREASNGPVRQPYDLNRLSLPIQDTIVTPRRLNSPLIFDGNRSIALASLKNTFDLGGNVNLVSITGASRLRVNYNSLDSLAQGNPNDPIFANLTIPIAQGVRVSTFSQEFNLKGDSGPVDWLVGAFYYNEINRTTGSVTLDGRLLGSPSALIRVSNGRSKRESASIFADATISVSDATRLFGGVRGLYERSQNDLLVTFQLPGGTVVQTDCSPGAPLQRVTDWSATGRIGLQHDLSDDVMAYGQLSRGYKSGGFSNSTCGNQYKPETVNAIETGLKARFLDRRATLNFAAFYYDYKNISVEQSTIFGTNVVGAPKSEIYGLDIDGRLQVNDMLSFDGNASFVHSEYKRFLSTGGAIFGEPDGTDLAGRALNKAPGASGTIGTQLEFPVGSGKITLRGEAYFTSGYRLREYNDPSLRQNAYELYNAFVTYEPNELVTVRGFVRNITKTNYIQGTVVQLNGVTGVYNPPRTYGVELALKIR